MRTHADTKMFHCQTCGKGFNQKGNLQAHQYCHTGSSNETGTLFDVLLQKLRAKFPEHKSDMHEKKVKFFL